MNKIILISLFGLIFFSCDSDETSIVDSNNNENDNQNNEEVSPNIEIISMDLSSYNDPYGSIQLQFQVRNNGDGPSSDYQYRINPCFTYNSCAFQGSTHTFPQQYLPGLDPGEYYVIETDNTHIGYFQNCWWSFVSSSCTTIY